MPTGTDTWVLLRGLTREARHWGGFPQVFARTLGGPHVILLDTPGNGIYYQQHSPTSIEAMLAHCRDEMRARDIPPPYSLLSLSLGSMIGTAWAERYPQELRRNVLINTSLRPFCPFYWRLRPGNYLPLLRQVLFGADGDKEALILHLTSTRANPIVLVDWLRYRHENPVSVPNALRQLLAATRFRAARQAPAVPTLILSGAGDQLVDPRCSRTIAQHWGVPIRVHPSAGHDLPLDDGQWVADQVAAWVQAVLAATH